MRSFLLQYQIQLLLHIVRSRSKYKTMSKRKRRSRRRTRRSFTDIISWIFRWQNFRWILSAALLLAITLGFYVYYLDHQVRQQFEGKRWEVPARVYARPLEIYPDMQINAEQFEN